MRGLVPIGAKLRSSLPGLTRQFIDLRKNFLAKKMDARVKRAHDELAKQLKIAPMGSSPRMTPMGRIPRIHVLCGSEGVDGWAKSHAQEHAGARHASPL